MTSLPQPVEAYFGATTPAGIADCFADDATVVDERRTHHGRAAILRWRETVGAISFRQEILSSRQSGGHVSVRCRVTGDFAGSPVELDYAFELTGALIARLEIV